MSGCAAVPKILGFAHLYRPAPAVTVRPIESVPAQASTVSPTDRLYESAKAAIEVRDYAHALDLLQLAKQQSPEDGRVLNALGVVYDKLGRFDLSARYYQLALAAEPNSPVVLANIQYSATLRTYATVMRDGPTPAKAPNLQMAAKASVPAAKSGQTARAKGPVLIGGPLVVVNATGRSDADAPVKRRLSSFGWTVSRVRKTAPARKDTVIVYGEQHRRVAEALARTLPFVADLQDCEGDCPRIELVLGANAQRKDWS